jgi:hypothetical protein
MGDKIRGTIAILVGSLCPVAELCVYQGTAWTGISGWSCGGVVLIGIGIWRIRRKPADTADIGAAEVRSGWARRFYGDSLQRDSGAQPGAAGGAERRHLCRGHDAAGAGYSHSIGGGIHSEAELLHALAALAPQWIAYVMSFLTLGIFWAGQQTQLNHCAKAAAT